MTFYGVEYLDKFFPRYGLFKSEQALREYFEVADPEMAVFYKAIPMTVKD